jgi:hypothetical protein
MKVHIRKNEVIGGGYWVFRVGAYGRVWPNPMPFEHAGLKEAKREAKRLLKLNPEKSFIVVKKHVARVVK